MQSDRTQPPREEEVKSSVTALSVARGFARAVLTEYGHLFNVHEAELVNHLTEVGIKSINGINWVLGKIIQSMPYSMQQSFFNYAVCPGYDNVIMLRKLMIRQKIEQVIKSGKKQFVILGGGYDISGLVKDVMEFAAGAGLSVTERFTAAYALEDIGDPNVEYYKANATKPLEIYYTMRKQAAISEMTIDMVPVIKLNLPEKPQVKASTGYCSLQ